MVVELVAAPKEYVPVVIVLKAVAVVLVLGAGVAKLPSKLNVGLTTVALVLIAFTPKVNAGFVTSEETGIDVDVTEFPKLSNADTAVAVNIAETSGLGRPNLNPSAFTVEITAVVVIGVEVVLLWVPNKNP